MASSWSSRGAPGSWPTLVVANPTISSTTSATQMAWRWNPSGTGYTSLAMARFAVQNEMRMTIVHASTRSRSTRPGST
jgi:hypothetical protein